MNTAKKLQQVLNIQEKVVLICKEQFIDVNISNRLNTYFGLNVIKEDDFELGLDRIKGLVPKMVVIDIDGLPQDSVKRIYRIIYHLQIPCLIISSQTDILNHLRSKFDTRYLSFLPKAVLNTLFNETTSLLLNKVTSTAKLKQRIRSAADYKHHLTTYLLATLLFIEPAIKVLYLKFQTDFSFELIFKTIFSMEGFLANFEFWALFPLAGYALLSVRSWSFLFFIGIQTYALFSYFTYEPFTWPYVAKSPHLSSSLMLTLNTALVLYFLVPEHLRPYWNRTRLIWRDTTRFATVLRAKMKKDQQILETTITNISETGAYFTTKESFQIGNKLDLEIDIDGSTKMFNVIIRREQDTAHLSYKGYGVEFLNLSKLDKKLLKTFVSTLTTRLQ